MNECKLSEINWTKVAVFAGGDRGHYRTDFDCFVGVDRGSLWVLEEKLPLALAVGDFDSVTVEEGQLIQERAQHFVQAQPEKDDTDLELALLTIFEKKSSGSGDHFWSPRWSHRSYAGQCLSTQQSQVGTLHASDRD